jgi:hypothetical protein
MLGMVLKLHNEYLHLDVNPHSNVDCLTFSREGNIFYESRYICRWYRHAHIRGVVFKTQTDD